MIVLTATDFRQALTVVRGAIERDELDTKSATTLMDVIYDTRELQLAQPPIVSIDTRN